MNVRFDSKPDGLRINSFNKFIMRLLILTNSVFFLLIYKPALDIPRTPNITTP